MKISIQNLLKTSLTSGQWKC